MGERTRSRIGTTEGVKTVRVYSANPRTADGYNTFIFRRDVARSLNKLAWAPVIDGSRNPIPEGVEVGGKSVRYSADDKRRLIEFVERIANAQKGPVENDDFGHFEITKVFATEVQCHAISTRREIEAVSSAVEIARSMVHFAGSPNEEVKRKKPNKYFEYGLAKIRLSDGVYLVMGEVGIRVNKRPYYDQRVVAKFKVDSEVTSLHGQAQIGESTFERIYDNRFRLILQGVELYYNSNQTNSNQTIKQSPKFSIIIPVYNVASYLHECLDSVCVAAEKACAEIICVDDGSTDGSGEILEKYRERLNVQTSKHLNFHVLHQQNAGVSAARNAALDVATGEWVWFVDGDDLIHPDSLKTVAEHLANHPSAEIVKIRHVSGKTPPDAWWRTRGGVSRLVGENDEERALSGLQGASQYLMKRVIVGDLRFEPYRWVEDVIFVVRYLGRCRDMLLTADILYFYREREGSAIRSRHTVEQVAEIFRALNALADAAGALVRRHADVDWRLYWKRLHAYAYFGFGKAYFRLPARGRKALLDDWLHLQARFTSCYPAPFEWRVRLVLARFLRSGLLVRPIILWGATLRGKVSMLVARMRGGRL